MTSRDVARVAGVSQATVSRVLHNNPSVSPEMRERVLKASAEIGYAVNAHARAMRTNRSGIIGVVTDRITNPFYPELVQSIASALTRHELGMILWTSAGSGEQTAVDAIRTRAVDGLIFTTARAGSEALREGLLSRMPIVLVNRSIEGAPCDQVTSDNITGGRLVADYFVAHGHTHVAVIGGDGVASTGRERQQGFLEQINNSSPDITASVSPAVDFTHEAGRETARQLYRETERPTALFCVNDILAFGALDAAAELGIKVPQELWIVGYDDVDMAHWKMSDLTTIRQPTSKMGQISVDMLLRRIKEPSAAIEHRRFGSELIVRGTTDHAAAPVGLGPVIRAPRSGPEPPERTRPRTYSPTSA